MENIIIRKATIDDADMVIGLYKHYSKAKLSKDLLMDCFQEFPAIILEIDGTIEGFAYCGRFAPDILELRNIFVSENCRYAGLGSKVLKEIELLSSHNYRGIILVNSSLYPVNVEKKSPKNFYIKNGYKKIMSTTDTDVYCKNGLK